MGKTIDTKIDDGILNFTFTNNEGEVFSSFRMNPTDINLAARCEEVAGYFEKRSNEVADIATAADAAKYNKELEEQLNYVLGYNASNDLFSEIVTATTILPNGSIFAYVIMDTILKHVEPEVKKRKKKMQENISKYTDKYK